MFEGKEYMYYCTKFKRKSNITHVSVSWSGGKLAVCELCGLSPWIGEAFANTHKKVIKQANRVDK
jgi:hypothetical protein